MPAPLLFTWDGETMRPKLPRVADKHFVIGEEYLLEEAHERSGNSHRHYFAQVHDAWLNLPEEQVLNFPNEDHLRRYALIKTGFFDSSVLVCRDASSADEAARFMRPLDEFSIITAEGRTVTRFTAKSQSYRSMGKDEFKRSKDAVLHFLAKMLGTDADSLSRNTREAA